MIAGRCRADRVLVEYFALRGRFVAFVVTAQAVRAVRLSVTERQVAQSMRLLELNGVRRSARRNAAWPRSLAECPRVAPTPTPRCGHLLSKRLAWRSNSALCPTVCFTICLFMPYTTVSAICGALYHQRSAQRGFAAAL